MKKINKSKLNALMMESLKLKYPNMPEAYIPKTEWNDNNANALTKCVKKKLEVLIVNIWKVSKKSPNRILL